jgi:hypothetical protein
MRTKRADTSPPPDERARFAAALDAVLEVIKQDRTILAAVLGGSLSHDRVWAKSDIDLVLVTADEKVTTPATDGGCALYADGVNIHAILMSRGDFRHTVDGARRNSFMHSFLAKGRLLYSHDPTIERMMASLADIGARDTSVAMLYAGCHAVATLYKAHKFFVTRDDLHYTTLWLLYTATPLAQIEVVSRRMLADREVVVQALGLNPGLFKVVYVDLIGKPPTRASVQRALDTVDAYLADRAPALFAPITEFLRDAGDARSATEIETHFSRHFGTDGVTTACEYLADRGLIGKASAPRRLTKRSNVDVQELAFYSVG